MPATAAVNRPRLALTSPAALSETAAAAGAPQVPLAESAATDAHRARQSRWLAVALLLALIAFGLAWELVLAPVRPGGSWLALKVLPLCLPLAGLLKSRMYTYRWLSLLVWVYFAEGVVRATSDRFPSAGYAIGQTLLCLALFAACAAHVRLRLRPARRQREAEAAVAKSVDGDADPGPGAGPATYVDIATAVAVPSTAAAAADASTAPPTRTAAPPLR